MKCPFCGSSDVERVKEWDVPKMGYHVLPATHLNPLLEAL